MVKPTDVRWWFTGGMRVHSLCTRSAQPVIARAFFGIGLTLGLSLNSVGQLLVGMYIRSEFDRT